MWQSVGLEVKKLENFKGDLLNYSTTGSSGFDVRAQLDKEVVVRPGERFLVPTGLAFAIPENYEIQVRPRSGLAIKHGISLVNTPGTVDADYRGEVKVILINHGREDFRIKDQERIAQFVLCPVVKAEFQWVDKLSDTLRGSGGFGSTGSN